MPEDSDMFRQFSGVFERWRWLTPPIGDIHDSRAPAYVVDLDLDHHISQLTTLGQRALNGDVAPDWPHIVPEYLADLDKIEKNVDVARITEQQNREYKAYILQCRLVWEKIALLPVPAEGRLGFRKAVLSHFRFLQDDYGFRIAETTPIRVRYESLTVCVELRHAPRSPEIGFELGRRRIPESCQAQFSLDDIIFWAGLSLQFDYAPFDFETRGGVADFFATAARLVLTHADLLLRGDEVSYATLEAKQLERERLIAANPG